MEQALNPRLEAFLNEVDCHKVDTAVIYELIDIYDQQVTYSEDEIGKHLLLTLKEQNSLADANNQKKVYTEMIAANKDWEFAGLYADI